jgi:hypothetical protein
MSDEQLIDAVATLWVENGGDTEGIQWCWRKISEAVEAKIKEKNT